jgi:hypothetical protein
MWNCKKLVVKCKTKKKEMKEEEKKIEESQACCYVGLTRKKKMKSCVRELSKESKEDVFFAQG